MKKMTMIGAALLVAAVVSGADSARPAGAAPNDEQVSKIMKLEQATGAVLRSEWFEVGSIEEAQNAPFNDLHLFIKVNIIRITSFSDAAPRTELGVEIVLPGPRRHVIDAARLPTVLALLDTFAQENARASSDPFTDCAVSCSDPSGFSLRPAGREQFGPDAATFEPSGTTTPFQRRFSLRDFRSALERAREKLDALPK